MSEYEYEAPEHAEPAADYPADQHLDLGIGDSIGQPLFDGAYEPAGHESGGYEGGGEAGYVEAAPGDGTPEGAQTYAGEPQGEGHLYAADSGDTAPAEGYAPPAEGDAAPAEGYAAPPEGYAAPPADGYPPAAR